jgi:PRTRC genetic system protein E
MFSELTALLANRTVLITVARENETALRVNVIPKLKEGENPALATSLSYTGTPEELDREFGKHLASYVECHVRLGNTLAQAKAEMEAAAKAAQDQTQKKAEERAKKRAEKVAPATGSARVAPQPADPLAANTLFPNAQSPSVPTASANPTKGGGTTCKLAL